MKTKDKSAVGATPTLLSGIILDSQTDASAGAGIEIALVEGINPGSVIPLATYTTKVDGRWSFDAQIGKSYTVRMLEKNTAIPSTPTDVWIFCGQAFANITASHTGIVIDATKFVGFRRTAELDARYFIGVYTAILRRFSERMQGNPSDQDVQDALREVEDTRTKFVVPFLGHSAHVPCSTCQAKCYNSPDPYCTYNCIYVPTHCY